MFWYVFRDIDLQTLLNELSRMNLFWIGASVILNMLSQLVRAYRWKTLFLPLKYKPRIINLYFAILVLAFTNQVIPRGGEIARLGVVNKYEKVPFSKLFGIALIERLTDFVILILIFIAILLWKFSLIQEILKLQEINLNDIGWQRFLIVTGIVALVVLIVIIIFKKTNLKNKFQKKIEKFKQDVHEGFSSILHIKNKFLYFSQSLLIYAIWLLMLYILFFAYQPTQNLGFGTAAFTFGLATMAFLIPVQAGMGAWHFVVIQCLLLFGVGEEAGKAFSLMAHSVTNHIYLITGIVAFVLIPLVNRE